MQARHWRQLARAVQQSTIDSSMDEMIQLLQDGVPGSRHPIVGVTFISFKTLEDIRQLLQSTPLDSVSKPQVSTLRPEAKPFVPSRLQRREVESGEGPNATDTTVETHDLEDPTPEADEQEEFKYERAEAHLADTTALVRSAVLARAQCPPSDALIQAASIVQAVYRRIVRRRRSISQEGLSVARTGHFLSCWSQAQEMSWPHRYYRLLFLGPLPHILLCLDAVQAYATSTKAKTKKRLGIAKHEELEELSTRQTEVR
jgi:hypothetical protein